MNANKDVRLAVLFDADNVPPSTIGQIMEEVVKYGMPTVKRIYGDFTSTRLSGWKDILNDHAISPMQQYRYTTGKNASDSALIIDAMDLLHAGALDGFVIVSSDSDFTRLATRLREGGKKVYGMGERKTPRPFINACEKFTYLELLRPSPSRKETGKAAAAPKAKPLQAVDAVLVRLVVSTVEDLAEESGWVQMGRLGDGLLKNRPDFDPRNFGFKRLTDLIVALSEHVRMESREIAGPGSQKNYYVRVREKRPLGA